MGFRPAVRPRRGLVPRPVNVADHIPTEERTRDGFALRCSCPEGTKGWHGEGWFACGPDLAALWDAHAAHVLYHSRKFAEAGAVGTAAASAGRGSPAPTPAPLVCACCGIEPAAAGRRIGPACDEAGCYISGGCNLELAE